MSRRPIATMSMMRCDLPKCGMNGKRVTHACYALRYIGLVRSELQGPMCTRVCARACAQLRWIGSVVSSATALPAVNSDHSFTTRERRFVAIALPSAYSGCTEPNVRVVGWRRTSV